MPNRIGPAPVPRRDFFGWAGLLSAGVPIIGSVFGIGQLTKPRALPEISARFRVGKRADFTSAM